MAMIRVCGLEGFLWNVEVRVDLRNVGEILEAPDESDDLLGLLAIEPHRVGWPHRDVGLDDLELLRLEGLLHGLEPVRRGVDGHERAVALDVLGAGVDREELELVGIATPGIELDEPLLLEEPLHRSGLAELAVVAYEGRTDLSGRPIAAV